MAVTSHYVTRDGVERLVEIDAADVRHACARDTEWRETGLEGPLAWVDTFDNCEIEAIAIAVTSCGLPACRCDLAWRPVPRASADRSAETATGIAR